MDKLACSMCGRVGNNVFETVISQVCCCDQDECIVEFGKQYTLRNYQSRQERFFASLKKGETLYEDLPFDWSPVTVVSWDEKEGKVTCSFMWGSKLKHRNINWYRLQREDKLTPKYP